MPFSDFLIAGFSERELTFTIAICCRPSVCLSSITLVHPTLAVQIFGNISTALGNWPSVNIHQNFYGYRPRGTPPSGELNTTGVASEFGPIEGFSPKRCKIGGKLVLITDRKSYVSFRLVSKSVTFGVMAVFCVILASFQRALRTSG